MHSVWPMVLAGLVMAAAGAWQLFAPIDLLWAQRERYLLSRGEAPQRSDVWESSERNRGIALIVLGLLITLGFLAMQASVPPKMSGVSIDGHELTQQEWDACGHDAPTCLSQYMNRPH